MRRKNYLKEFLPLLLLGSGFFLALSGCGEDESDPEAVTVAELKAPFALKVFDKGNGTVELEWGASNNEDDFDGYNVYGIKTDNTTTFEDGKAIELLDSEGKPLAATKEVLQSMNFNGTNLETVGEAPTQDPDADERKFAFYPIYETTDSDGKPEVPTCRPTATTGADNLCKNPQTNAESYLNGRVTYQPTFSLTVGSRYCFLVLSVKDEGTEVSQTSSNIACIVPKYKVSVDLDFTTNSFMAVDLADLRTACAAGQASCVVNNSTNTTVSANYCNNAGSVGGTTQTDNIFCLEKLSSGISITPVNQSAAKDIGYYPLGFEDPFLPDVVPLTSALVVADLERDAGYSPSGQSLVLQPDHFYSVASAKSTDSSTFYYDLFFVTSDTLTTSSTALTGELWLSKNAE